MFLWNLCIKKLAKLSVNKHPGGSRVCSVGKYLAIKRRIALTYTEAFETISGLTSMHAAPKNSQGL